MRAIISAVLAGLIASTCLAQPNDKWKDLPDNVRKWFQTPAIQTCCSLSDGEETEYDIRKDGYYIPVPWNEHWERVPSEKVINTQGNPVGRAIVWLNIGGHEIRCFVPGGGF